LSKIGILGGTFDPPHKGHIAIAKAALNQLGLDKVIFIPAQNPPHKLKQTVASTADRFKMLELAIDGINGFEISDIELRRPGISYTADTLDELCRIFPGVEFYLLIGADNISEIESWYDPERILKLARVAAANRPGFVPGGIYTGRILNFEMPPVDLSSTEVRSRINAGLPIDDLVPKGVAEYIVQHRLYIKE
jgi:nicotinate-nucleotide adenylyltransferase